MKTTKVLFWVSACVMAVAAVAIAEDTEKPADKPAVQAPERPGRPLPGRGPIAAPSERGRGPAEEATQRGPGAGGPMMGQDMMRNIFAGRMEAHKAEIAKLEAIVKIAEEEKATKTVEALKALIAEKDKAMKDQIDQIERRRQEMQQRMQERAGEAAPQQAQPQQRTGSENRTRPEQQPERGTRQGGARRGQQREQAN